MNPHESPILNQQEVDRPRFHHFYDLVGVLAETVSSHDLTNSLKLRPTQKYRGNNKNTNWAMKKQPGWLGYIGDEILPSFIGIIINHCKDPY